jgi:hypothetical protein
LGERRSQVVRLPTCPLTLLTIGLLAPVVCQHAARPRSCGRAWLSAVMILCFMYRIDKIALLRSDWHTRSTSRHPMSVLETLARRGIARDE